MDSVPRCGYVLAPYEAQQDGADERTDPADIGGPGLCSLTAPGIFAALQPDTPDASSTCTMACCRPRGVCAGSLRLRKAA